MKDFIFKHGSTLVALFAVMCSILLVSCGGSEEPLPFEPPDTGDGTGVEYLSYLIEMGWSYVEGYWAVIVPVLWMVVRLTPTKKDNDILRLVLTWIDWLVPNKKKGGGDHNPAKPQE